VASPNVPCNYLAGREDCHGAQKVQANTGHDHQNLSVYELIKQHTNLIFISSPIIRKMEDERLSGRTCVFHRTVHLWNLSMNIDPLVILKESI
jgi:hypothetical protein